MTTAAKDPVPFYTGFCGVRTDQDSHGRCPQVLHVNDRTLACACTCHTPAALTVVPDSPAAAVAAPVGGGEQTDDLGDALAQLTGAVATLDRSLASFAGTDVETLDLLGHLRTQRQALAQIESVLEGQAARLMTDDVVTWDGGMAERRWGKDRKEWKHDDLTRAVTAAIVPVLAVDPASGEVDGDLAALLHQAIEQYAATNRPSWRVTAVKPLGIDPDDYCTAVPGRATVQVTLAEAQP